MGAARSRAAKIAALVLYIIVILVATPQAQQPVAFSGSPGAVSRGPAATPPDATAIDLLVGRSTVLNVGSVISRVSLTVPDVADAMVTAPQELLIHGKAPGTISLFVWDRAGGIKTYEVNVRRDLKQLVDQMVQLFPGEGVTVIGSGKDVVLSGTVSSKYVIDKAGEVASGYVDKKENVVNLLKQQEGVASNQVMLRVRFAEVSRSAMQELGASFILDRFKSGMYDVRTSTQQYPAPDFDSSKPGQLNFSDFLNLFVFNSKEGIGAVVKALQGKGLFQSLAEPNLIALNGKEASFLAGGEYPYPVVQPGGGSGGSSVTIMFKEFGVRLHFTPTILGNGLIHLKVAPEVSSLDFSNAITLQGFRVPALSTRKTETEVELQDGQTFAVAGLMNNTLNSTMQKIPGIGDIPVLGYLFRSRAYQKNQTELVVMITPVIVRAGSTGASSGLPAALEPYLAPPAKTIAQPAPYVGSPAFPPSQSSQPSRPGGAPQGAEPVQPAAVAPMPAVAPAAPALATRPAASAPVHRADVTPAPAPKADSKGEAREREAQRKAAEAQKTLERKAADVQKLMDARAAEEKAAADKKAAEAQAVADKRATEDKAVADKKAAEEKAVADKKAAEDKARLDKLKAERDRHEAEVARKNAEIARRKAEEDRKHQKPLQEAAARLKAAQAAYEAELQKKKGV